MKSIAGGFSPFVDWIHSARSNGRMVWVLLKRELLQVYREPARLLGIFLQPIVFWWVLGFGFAPSFHLPVSKVSYPSYFFVGALVLLVLFTGIFSTITLIEDRQSGFLQMVLCAPAHRVALVVGKVLGVSLLALLQALFFIGIFFVFQHTQFPRGVDWVLFGSILGVGTFGLVGMGFVLAWWASSTAVYHAVMSLVFLPLWVLSGALFPPVHPWMRYAVLYNPMGWMVGSLRAVWFGDAITLWEAGLGFSPHTALVLLSLFALAILLLGTALCSRYRA